MDVQEENRSTDAIQGMQPFIHFLFPPY